MTPQIGDIWYNEPLNIHVLIMEEDEDKKMAGWHLSLILETGEYNWWVIGDFPKYNWIKAA